MNIERALARYIDYGSSLKLIKRSIRINDAENFIKALVGPRRAGKSSMMLILMQNLREKGEKPVYINGEDIDFVGITADGLDGIEDAIYRIYRPEDTRIHLFIDEVQSFPEWSRWLRTIFDENKYNIFVSGSTSELESDELSSVLRGRVLETLVLPFSFDEYCTAKGVVRREYMDPKSKSALIGALSDFLDFGGYPEVVKEDSLDIRKSILENLYKSVLQHDIIEKYRIRKINEFRLFMNAVFGSACRDLSLAKTMQWFDGQGIRISNQTVSNYLRYAESVFLVRLLYQYSRKPKERKTKPKAYPLDAGILGLFENSRGKKLEDAVFVELLRRGKEVYYYKHGATDVDFVIVENGLVSEIIQVSYSIADANAYNREISSIEKALKELECNKASIITFDEERTIQVNNAQVAVVPAWKWLLSR